MSISQRASRIPPEEQQYVLPGFIPRGTLSMIAGKRNAGKSLIGVWLAEALTTGQVPGPDGTIVTQAPVDVWINSQEDPVKTVLNPRVHATKADFNRVILSGHTWSLPGSLGAIRDELVHLREDGLDPAVLILDSMQQHFHNPGHGLVQNRDAMVGLKNFAEEYDISILFIHHLVKGKHATVESMIGGMTVLQNLSKTIFVFGGFPSQSSATGVLACERHGYGPRPISLSFERVTRTVRKTGSKQPFLEYVGPIGVSAMDVLAIAKKDEKGPGGSGQARAADFIRKHLRDSGLIGKPIRIVQLEQAAIDNGRWYSKGTFGRAREQAGLRALSRSEVERMLGTDWKYESPESQRAHWVVLDGGLEDEGGDETAAK